MCAHHDIFDSPTSCLFLRTLTTGTAWRGKTPFLFDSPTALLVLAAAATGAGVVAARLRACVCGGIVSGNAYLKARNTQQQPKVLFRNIIMTAHATAQIVARNVVH